VLTAAASLEAGSQNLGQRIGKSSWLRELENISVGHSVQEAAILSGLSSRPLRPDAAIDLPALRTGV
jgi:hypothetical protein